MKLHNESPAGGGAQYIAQGKPATFQALKAFLDPINTKSLPSYEEAAAQLKVSVGAVKTLIHRVRNGTFLLSGRRSAALFSDSADVDAEIHELCEALIAAEGQIMP